jgi:malate dehydrogenase
MIGMVGAGRVGAQAALELATQGVDDITMVDIVEGLAEGEALDISHKLSETGVDVNVTGSKDYSTLSGAEVVVITAGLARKPGMTRMDLLGKNTGIIASVAKEVAKYAPNAVLIMVTNPMDAMTYLLLRGTGFPRERVVGMGGILDLSRFKYVLAKKLSVSRSSISSVVIGEHGENMVPLASRTSVGGVPLTTLLSEAEIAQAVEDTRKVAAEVIAKKGATVDAPGNAIARMAKAVVWDKKDVLPASTMLSGEYRTSGICIGVPLKLGRSGVEKIYELELTQKERAAFDLGANTIKLAISSLPPL